MTDKMAVHYSSKTPICETPQDFFDELNKEFNFEDIDKSCLVEKLKLGDDWFTKSDLVILRVGNSCKILKSRY